MSANQQLFSAPKPPRRKPRVLMHFTDVGFSNTQIATFKCRRCEHQSDWVPATDTEVRRGIACPVCNKGQSS